MAANPIISRVSQGPRSIPPYFCVTYMDRNPSCRRTPHSKKNVENYFCSVGKIFAAVVTTEPRLNTVGSLEFSLLLQLKAYARPLLQNSPITSTPHYHSKIPGGFYSYHVQISIKFLQWCTKKQSPRKFPLPPFRNNPPSGSNGRYSAHGCESHHISR